MKKRVCLLLSLLLLAALLPPLPRAKAQVLDELGLESYIQNEDRRRYVQAMVGYHLRYDPAVVENLEAGYSAVFFFEGCSDNMDDRIFKDILFYRVSAVCLAVRLDDQGKPRIVYFNGQCSTLPDRPLDYGKRKKELGQKSGPATILDGTYEIYSVRHGGAYEALHLRTSEEDETIPAVYMTEEGYAVTPAEMINIHTRNVNHILQEQMWSAGCILVGDGDFSEFADLVAQTYYPVYDDFEVGERVGTVTIDRQYLKEELYALYENEDAVDRLLAASRQLRPEAYLFRCGDEQVYEEPVVLWAGEDAPIMTLPCTGETDPRSVLLEQPEKGAEITILGTVENDQGEIWYKVESSGQSGYLQTENAIRPGLFAQRIRSMFGRKKSRE